VVSAWAERAIDNSVYRICFGKMLIVSKINKNNL